MTLSRTASYARLFADAEAWPLVSEAAFRLRTLALSRPTIGVLDASTASLADELEEHLRLRAGGMSLDALRHLRDEAWFDGESLSVELGTYVRRLARKSLSLQGNRIALIPDDDLCHRAAHWRWLSLLLPADILVAALAADRTPVEPPDDGVALLTPQLRRLLEAPAAETHLHASAAASFGTLWTGLVRSLGTNEVSTRALGQGGRPPFGSAERFHGHLLHAALVRLLLASYLWSRDKCGGPANLRSFLDGELYSICARLRWPRGEVDAWRTCLRMAGALTGAERGAPELPVARHLYRMLLGPSTSPPPRSLDDLARRDPLAAWLPPGAGLALPETRFTARALQYLGEAGKADTLFAGWFWQYQRVRCVAFRHLTQEPGTAGLDWFRRHFSRISALGSALRPVRFASALRLASAELNLASFEARVAPEPSWSGIRDVVRSLADAARRYQPRAGADRPEVGLVLHFTKNRERPGGRQLEADPRQLAHGCRYGAWANARLAEANAIATALRNNPELLLVLRGIDAASVELAVPTWPFVPIFQRVREASAAAAAVLRRTWPLAEITPIHATFHAGEDFRRLSEGLRRIHELIEFGLLQSGDRIGHGIALGESPKRWAKGAHEVTQPAEDRLDDLLWELDRYRHGDLPLDARRVELVRAEIQHLGELIYGRSKALSADMLVVARRSRHDAALLDRLGFPFIRRSAPEDAIERLVFRHLVDPDVFSHGQRPVRVKVDDAEIAMLRSAGRWLRAEIGALEITIESNPSSNLLIGDFVDVEAHPAFRLQPLRGEEPRGGAPVLLSVNDDDPLTFATRLSDEFAYLYFALLRSGVAANDALAWLAAARENGYRSRFTLPASSDPDALVRLASAIHAWTPR